MTKMNPNQIDLYTAAFGGGEGSDGAFSQVICRKIQQRIERKALNKGLGLNEDGTMDLASMRRMTAHDLQSANEIARGSGHLKKSAT